jgi:RNase P subunit RPR2
VFYHNINGGKFKMYLFNEKDDKLGIECDGCGKIYMYNKKYFSHIAKTECVNNTLIQCPNCKRSVQPFTKIESRNSPTAAVKCPYCGSTQITTGNKGFGVSKAAAGVALFGVVGAVGGLIGSSKTMITCLKCGKKWEAGK